MSNNIPRLFTERLIKGEVLRVLTDESTKRVQYATIQRDEFFLKMQKTMFTFVSLGNDLEGR